MHLQNQTLEVINKPAPEFDDISYDGDGRKWVLDGEGKAGIVVIPPIPGQPVYNNALTEMIKDNDDPDCPECEFYRYNCDYLIKEKVKIQGVDIKVSNADSCDFLAVEILYLAVPEQDIWVMGKRFVKRFYLTTDFEDQDTPNLPYGKTLEAGQFIVRIIYYKRKDATHTPDLRVNYILHKVEEQSA